MFSYWVFQLNRTRQVRHMGSLAFLTPPLRIFASFDAIVEIDKTRLLQSAAKVHLRLIEKQFDRKL